MVPGAAHHVTQRGNYRQDVFFAEDDRRMYLSFLRESAERNGLAISAYCLMTNHVHVLATPEKEDALAKTFGRTHLMYAQYIHRLHGRSGHLWQGRFYSCPMDEAHAVNAAAYIELNPVRAGIAKHAWNYAWSSAAAHCGTQGDATGLLDLSAWFAVSSTKEWRQTLRSVGGQKAVCDQIRVHLTTGHPLGSDKFLSKVETYLGRRLATRAPGRPKGSKDKQPRVRRPRDEDKR